MYVGGGRTKDKPQGPCQRQSGNAWVHFGDDDFGCRQERDANDSEDGNECQS